MTTLLGVIGSLPSPSSNGFSIGPLNLRAYGLMIALGVIAAVWLLGRLFEQYGVGTRDDASSVATWGVVAGILGARLYHVATDWSRFADDLGAIPKIWEGGLGIPGGLLAGIAVGAWQARRRGLPVAATMTCAAPALPLAQAIGRWGNWFNQELYGRPTDLPWALEIDDQHLPSPDTVPGATYHPTFLYESLWNVALCAFLLWVQRRYRLGAGRLLGVYLIGYGAGRFWIEGLRIDPSRELAGMRWNQWVALAAIVGGAAYLLRTRGRTWVAPTRGVAAADDDDVSMAEADLLVDSLEPDGAMVNDGHSTADDDGDAETPVVDEASGRT